jgi:hypothetical protein
MLYDDCDVPRFRYVPVQLAGMYRFRFRWASGRNMRPTPFRARADRLTRSGAVLSASARARAAAQLLTDFGYR